VRRLIVSNLMSLDGFFEGPNKEFDWFVPDEEFFDYSKQLLRSVDTLIFGARTYAHMAAYWPSAPPDEIADKMNNLPKIVFSKTLKQAHWKNSRLAGGNTQEEITKLKEQPGKDMVILGSASLASSVLQMGLIDQYRVILNPILLGRGNPLFQNLTGRIRMKLLKTKTLRSGVVILYYEKA